MIAKNAVNKKDFRNSLVVNSRVADEFGTCFVNLNKLKLIFSKITLLLMMCKKPKKENDDLAKRLGTNPTHVGNS